MTINELEKLGVKNPEEVKILPGKWVAMFFPNANDKSEGMSFLKESDGNIAAYENLVDLQLRLPLIIPGKDARKIDNQFIKRHIIPRHIQEKIDSPY